MSHLCWCLEWTRAQTVAIKQLQQELHNVFKRQKEKEAI